MSFGPTFMQRRLLALLESAYLAGDPMPSQREIAKKIGFKSPSGVSRIMDRMEERGIIRRLRGHARAVELTNPPTAPNGAVELALAVYCQETGRKRNDVIASALRAYFRLHPASKVTKETA